MRAEENVRTQDGAVPAAGAAVGRLLRFRHGPSVELARVLGDADLFLSSSETESFGLSMLEAMSSGVPCVSTRVGGVAEVFGDTGTLVPLGDIEAMADAATALLRDEAAHRSASEKARARAIEAFRAEVVLERYLELYRRVASMSAAR